MDESSPRFLTRITRQISRIFYESLVSIERLKVTVSPAVYYQGGLRYIRAPVSPVFCPVNLVVLIGYRYAIVTSR